MRATLRTLAVLRGLNVRNGATVAELSKSIGVSRPALYRILETLRGAGYVSVDLEGQRYGLTWLVRSLAESFTREDWIAQAARPVLKQLQKEVVWPVDLGTFADGAMWIRETTRGSSPLTMDRGVVGIRFPMLLSATGRAYLAYCAEQQRELILDHLARSAEPGAELARDGERIVGLLEQTRSQRFGHRYGKREPPAESGAIAVPIRDGQDVLGCINVTFAAKAMRPQEAAARYLHALTRAAARIAADAAALGRGRTVP